MWPKTTAASAAIAAAVGFVALGGLSSTGRAAASPGCALDCRAEPSSAIGQWLHEHSHVGERWLDVTDGYI